MSDVAPVWDEGRVVPIHALLRCFTLLPLRWASRRIERDGAAPTLYGFLGIVVSSIVPLLSCTASSWR